MTKLGITVGAWRPTLLAFALVAGLGACASVAPATSVQTLPAAGTATRIPGVSEGHLQPGYWIARSADAHTALLTPAAIAAQNARLLAQDPSMHDLAALPASIPGSEVRGWIQALSAPPSRTLYGEDGKPIAPAQLQALQAALALDRLPASITPRFGLVVRRTPQRAFPTRLRVFRSNDGNTDIDRWQESAEFPGTPVAVLHASADGQWVFAVSTRYRAWMPTADIALGERAQVLAYAARTPYRVITGAKPRTVYTPENAAVSELQLDMGMRYPLAGIDTATRIHGQVAGYHWPLQLPVRNADASLGFAVALLPRSEDSAAEHLPLTRANLLTQAFKFLGERYGWGHDYNGRDCSGFVAEVYRSMGLVLPRNTSDQARSPALRKTLFDASASRASREAAVAALEVGDLIYIPGHVMMFIGNSDGAPYVIHDTSGGTMGDDAGSASTLGLNGVVVTPLRAMRAGEGKDYIDVMTSIVRPQAGTP